METSDMLGDIVQICSLCLNLLFCVDDPLAQFVRV